MSVRAVVFDLWDTIVEFRSDESERDQRRIAERLGVPYERFREVWYEEELYRTRNTGPLAPCFNAALETLGVEADVEELVGSRREFMREQLLPREGLLETLEALRERGLRVGLISNCTEEVADCWADTTFAPFFDGAVFSATALLAKPDPEIYLLAARELGVQPEECLFVGDGANDELRGARDVGMTPVLIAPEDREPYWREVQDWDGHRITALPQVLDLVR